MRLEICSTHDLNPTAYANLGTNTLWPCSVVGEKGQKKHLGESDELSGSLTFSPQQSMVPEGIQTLTSLWCRGQNTNFERMKLNTNLKGPLFFTILYGKGIPFIYLLLKNGTPLTYLVRTLHPFNFCKCTVFKIWINKKTRAFLQLFHSQKVHY